MKGEGRRVKLMRDRLVLYSLTDGLDMYPINPLNPAMYPEDKKYMCGHWLVEYEKLHNGNA